MSEPDGSEVEFSLTRGGLLYRLLIRTGIVRPGRRDALRPAIAFAILTWAPMALASVLRAPVTRSLPGVMLDPAVHARLLVAIPLFFASEALLDERCAKVFRSLVEGFVDKKADALAIARRCERLRDSVLVEPLMLFVGVDLGIAILFGASGSTGVVRGMRLESGVSAALVWYALVGFPLFVFLFLRLFYRWGIWCGMLGGLARLDLRLMPSHPDLAGGVGFLAHPVQAFSLFGFACSTVAAANWGYRIAVEGTDLNAFSAIFLLFVAVVVALALGPLLFFTRSLLNAKIEGIRQYEDLALRYTRLFHDRWIVHPDDASLLGSADIQSLADMGGSYERVEKMRMVPFGPRAVVIVLAATVIPMAPLAALTQPIPELISKLGHALLGGLPH
jgi:hypothetical protein